MFVGFAGCGGGGWANRTLRRRDRSVQSTMCSMEGSRSTPPVVLTDLSIAIKKSVRSAVLYGLRGFQVDVSSDETRPYSKVYDEMLTVSHGAAVADALIGMMSEEDQVLLVVDLKQDIDRVRALFSEEMTSVSSSRVRIEPLVVGELSANRVPAVEEEDTTVIVLAPTNASGRSVTAHVRKLIRSAGPRRVVIVNQRLDSILGIDSNGRPIQAGSLPIELDRYQHAYYWESFAFSEKGKNSKSIKDIDTMLIVHRLYPEPFCVYQFDLVDRTCIFREETGTASPPTLQTVARIASTLL